MTKRRLLLVTRNLPPIVGGMERLMWHIVDGLRHDFQIHVIGPSGCREHLPEGVAADEVPLKPVASMLAQLASKALQRAQTFRPNIVLAGSGLTAPMAYLAAQTARARSVVYLHGLDVDPPSRIYRLLWQPFLRRMDRVIANSRFTAGLAEGIGIPADKIAIVHPGVTLPPWEKREIMRRAFRERYGLGDAPVMLYVGRITPRKGLNRFLKGILPQVIRKIPEVKLVVIGDQPREALLRREQVPIEELVRKDGLQDRVLLLGERRFNDPELSAAYFAADVLVFPVQDLPGDPEGFGMVALEAAAHGTPTVAYRIGGVQDAIRDGVSGILIAPGKEADFLRALLVLLTSPPCPKAIRSFAEDYRWEIFANNLKQTMKI